MRSCQLPPRLVNNPLTYQLGVNTKLRWRFNATPLCMRHLRAKVSKYAIDRGAKGIKVVAWLKSGLNVD
jgi:hypothetical protein